MEGTHSKHCAGGEASQREGGARAREEAGTEAKCKKEAQKERHKIKDKTTEWRNMRRVGGEERMETRRRWEDRGAEWEDGDTGKERGCGTERRDEQRGIDLQTRDH
ncbi:hypothetical protein L208DRAFT_1375164 [Tricholoma matsutake]|nr:hypothetical protein L208DRAFT_1375164 [Tricholoma matsutake 945]